MMTVSNSLHIEVILQEKIDERWTSWFDGLQVEETASGSSCIRGELADHAALHGLLERVRDLNLKLVTVHVASVSERKGE